MIEIVDVRKSFEGKPVLRGIDLNIPDQMSMVILGSSGCGKTVLLRSIIGLFKPDRGKILVDGEDIGDMDRENLFRVGYHCLKSFKQSLRVCGNCDKRFSAIWQ